MRSLMQKYIKPMLASMVLLAFGLLFFSRSILSETNSEELIRKRISGDKDFEHFIYWESNNSTYKEAAESISNLYLGLYNSDMLATKEIVFDNERYHSVIDVFTYLDIPYVYWNSKIDNLLCDINPHVCIRKREGVVSKENSWLLDNVGGTKFTKPKDTKWTVSNKKTLIIPDIKFEKHVNFKQFVFDNSDTIRELHDRNARGCLVRSEFEPEVYRTKDTEHSSKLREYKCALSIASVNWSGWYGNAKTDSNSLDEFSNWELTFRKVVSNIFQDKDIDFDTIDIWQNVDYLAKKYGDYEEGSKKMLNVVMPVMTFEAVISIPKKPLGLSNNLKSQVVDYTVLRKELINALNGTAALYSLKDFEKKVEYKRDQSGGSIVFDQVFNEQREMFSIINHPFNNNTKLPESAKSRVPIGLIDNGFETSHCEIKEGGRCGDTIHSMPRNEFGHGHLVGTVATAKNGNGGMVGVNPYAQIESINMDLNRDARILARRIGKRVTEIIRRFGSPQVFNISGHWYPRGTDLFEQFLLDNERALVNRVFVVSSGNIPSAEVSQLKEYNYTCTVLPACLSTKFNNVIAVVGIEKKNDGSLDIWDDGKFGSFFHKDFDIAAPVGNIVVPFKNNDGSGYAKTKGTSFAPPQVSATIAMLQSIDHSISAKEIKERLIACSQQFPKLFFASKGGVLDVECTLNINKTIIKTHTALAGKSELFIGDVRRIINKDSRAAPFYPVLIGNKKTKAIPLDNLLRYQAKSTNMKAFIYHNMPNNKRKPSIVRLNDTVLDMDSYKVELVLAKGTKAVCIPFNEIADYIPALNKRTFENVEQISIDGGCN